MTVNDLITDALTLLEELMPGQTPSPDDQTVCFAALNALLDSWSIERLSIYTVKRVQFTLTAGQQDYTIGPTGADFTNERPVLIQTAVIVLATS